MVLPRTITRSNAAKSKQQGQTTPSGVRRLTEAGIGTVEYIGVTVVIAVIIVGIAAAPLGKPLREGTQATICTITTGDPAINPDGTCARDRTQFMAQPPEETFAPPPLNSEDREGIIERAQFWVEQGVPYSMSAWERDPNGKMYRTDCSGFVSMAWGLENSETTVSLPNHAHQISKDELQPGDILLKGGPGTEGANGHVVIFNGWANEEKTAYHVLEQAGGVGAVSRVMPYPYAGDNSYVPYRKNGM